MKKIYIILNVVILKKQSGSYTGNILKSQCLCHLQTIYKLQIAN